MTRGILWRDKGVPAKKEATPKTVKVRDPYTGKEVELEPKKVWELKPKNRKGVKIGLFKSESGKYFRAKVPDNYPTS